MSEIQTRLYECGYVLVPTIPESEVPTAVEAIKSLITSAGATITIAPDPEYIDLAYTMEKTVGSKKSKYSQGYFGFIKFETAPDTLEQIKKVLDAHLELVRYILLKTDADNTIVFKKPKLEAKRDSAPIDEAELIADEAEEDMELDHEKLPDLAAEVADEITAPEPEEAA
jgi:ribosomal protein S6